MSTLSPESETRQTSTPRPRRRIVAWDPGFDTLIAFGTLLAFWGCYWAGSTGPSMFLTVGIIVVATIIPAWTVLHLRREGLAGLGVRRRFLWISLAASLVLGALSIFGLVGEAAGQNIELLPHVVGNFMVLWEPLFVFGWLFLRWERAFGWLPAIVLTGLGFALQHVGAVPLAAAISFGVFALAFGVVFVFVRNLFILWPLFYPVTSSIGTLQSGFVMDWGTAITGAILLVVQMLIVGAIWAMARRRGAAGRPVGAGWI